MVRTLCLQVSTDPRESKVLPGPCNGAQPRAAPCVGPEDLRVPAHSHPFFGVLSRSSQQLRRPLIWVTRPLTSSALSHRQGLPPGDSRAFAGVPSCQRVVCCLGIHVCKPKSRVRFVSEGQCSVSSPVPKCCTPAPHCTPATAPLPGDASAWDPSACPCWFLHPLFAASYGSSQPSCGLPCTPASPRPLLFSLLLIAHRCGSCPLLMVLSVPSVPVFTALTTPLCRAAPHTHCSPAWPPRPASKVPVRMNPSRHPLPR
ncbi:uncharacterized protein LOC125081282 [Lutra lutra]|uniref:uncharacterized protein LOC125081282 n=1 Tax=Lutra lutra TaxID=9657 RepID=UPI001FD587C0|nr:uncharacterized protein LOC125081282 [Lutra lutra]